jgi:hypothetical protein
MILYGKIKKHTIWLLKEGGAKDKSLLFLSLEIQYDTKNNGMEFLD